MPAFTAKDIDDLKRRLPRGYFKMVMEKVTCNKKAVADFFSGYSYHTEVHFAALDVAEQHERQLSERMKNNTG